MKSAGMAKRFFMQGNEACAEGAIAAGCKLFAGYPITPATEIAEIMSQRLPQVGGVYVQGEDEIASLAMVVGASTASWKAMTATSGNGICLMQEEIAYAAMTEVPCVLVDAQRVGPGAGSATKAMQGDFYQVRYGGNADYSIIALAPDSPQEMFELTVKAFNLAEEYRTPVFVMSDEIISHMYELVQLPSPDELKIVNRVKPTCEPSEFVPFEAPENGVPPMPAFGDGYAYPLSSFTRNEKGIPSVNAKVHDKLVSRLWNKIELNADKIVTYETAYLDDAEVVFVSYGSVSRSVRRAVENLRQNGTKAGWFRLITLWPFPDAALKEVASAVGSVIVPEMSQGKLVREVQRAVGGKADVIPFSKAGVEMHRPQEIEEFIRRVL